MTIEQISVFLENKPGRLAEVTKIMGDAGVDLRAMSLADTADFGVLRLMVNDPEKTLELLRAAGCVVSVTPVLAVCIADKPGSLAEVLSVLADAGVSVEYSYASITRKKDNAYVIFRVDDNGRALEAFAKHGITAASAKDLFNGAE
ncbi:MAG: ACT domain-containing protein [Synergistaceae bacterium]|nr:ACT domain-containing protein [Synergistaceae bacterium]